MDDQNWTEKIGILREMGDIRLEIEKLRGEIKNLAEAKSQSHVEMMGLIKSHAEELYGNGKEGLKTIVDRLNETQKNRRAHFIAIYGMFLAIIADLVANYFYRR